MRIVFTTKIAPIYSQSDVSHNGLFIGLWTMAEVALGFIVSCSLSLPLLIQAKRKKFSSAVSYLSSPFSTNRSKSSNPTTVYSTTRGTSRCSDHIQLRPSPQPNEKPKANVNEVYINSPPEIRNPPPRPVRDPGSAPKP